MVMTSGMYHILFEPAKSSEYKEIKNNIRRTNKTEKKNKK